MDVQKEGKTEINGTTYGTVNGGFDNHDEKKAKL